VADFMRDNFEADKNLEPIDEATEIIQSK